MKKFICFVAIFPFALLLISCISQVTDLDLNNAKDEINPLIRIINPAEYSSFGRTIVITGTVTDQSTAQGEPGNVMSLTYEILTHTSPETVAINSDGTFQVTISTDLRENIVIEFKATDWNGNFSVSRLPLVYEGNDIPSFSAISGNREVTLNWDPVPGVDSYTIYFETSALAPTINSAGQIENVTSPYVLGNLKNGKIYSFLLRGISSTGVDNYSEVKRSVPLSSFDLFPSVSPYFNHIQIAWRPFPGISEYEVMRATSPDGVFSSVSGPISGDSYSDGNIQQDATYYYAVKLAQYSDTLSEVAEAIPDPFPSYLNAEIAVYSSVNAPWSSAIKDNYLFIADYSSGLHVANINEPTTPIPVTTASLSSARDIVIQGDYAYVTHWQSLSIFDISNPSSPVLKDTIQVTSSQAEGITVLGDLAFVACFDDGFSVIDVSNKNSISEVYHAAAGTDGLGQVYNMAAVDLSGKITLFVTSNPLTAIYEVTGPISSPSLVNLSTSMSGADDVKVIGNYAYITSGWFLEVYDITNPNLPILEDSIWPDPSNPVEALDVANGRAYATIRDTGFCVIDVTDPKNIALVQSYATPGEARGITVFGNYAYLSDGFDYGVNIFGIANPSSGILEDTYSSLNGPTNIAVMRDHLFVTEKRIDWALVVIDATQPSSLSLAGDSGDTFDYTPVDLKIVGQYALFAAERSGTMIYDISDVSNPQVMPPWYVNLPGGYAIGIDVFGNYAYITTEGSGSSYSQLNIVDLSWEANLSKVGNCDTQTVNTSYDAVDIAVRNNYAFIANSEAGLRVVDVSNPKWPAPVSNFGATTGRAVSVTLSGDYAYVADETNGLYIFDISNPESSIPTVRSPGSEGGITDVVVRGNFAYLAEGANGIEMFDITDPANPVSVLNYVTPTPAVKLMVNRQYVYVMDGTNNLYAINLMP